MGVKQKQTFTISQKSFQCIGLRKFQPDINVMINDFNFEVKRITKKFLSAGFPRNFIRNTIERFNKDKDDYIVPEWLFDQ